MAHRYYFPRDIRHLVPLRVGASEPEEDGIMRPSPTVRRQRSGAEQVHRGVQQLVEESHRCAPELRHQDDREARNIGSAALPRSPRHQGRDLHHGLGGCAALEVDDRMMNDIYTADEVSYTEQDAYVVISATETENRAPSGLVRLSQGTGGSTTPRRPAGDGITGVRVVDTGSPGSPTPTLRPGHL